jgi:serine/threonine-protein kinase
MAGQNDEAIQQLQTVLVLDPDFFFAHRVLGAVYLAKKMYGEAIEESQKAVALTGGSSSNDLGFLGGAYAVAGKRTEAIQVLTDLKNLAAEGQYINPVAWFYVYSGLGDVDEALYWLEKCIDERQELVGWLKVWPYFDPLRDHPRFQELLSRINFPE